MAFQPDEDFWLPRISPQLPSITAQPPANDDPLAGASKIAFHSENAEWWVGVQSCAARFAIATLLALTSVATSQAIAVYSYRQDDPAGNLKAVPEELYWQNPVAPAPPTILARSQSAFDVQEPSGNLHVQPEADFWTSGVIPVSQAIWQPLPYFFSTEEVVPQPVLFQPDEDYWQGWTPPIAAANPCSQPFTDAGDATQLFGQFDEDFWSNPTFPVLASLFQRLPYLPDLDDLPMGALHGQFDEDFSQNLVSPIVTRNVWPQPFFDSGEFVFGLAQEEYWCNQVAPIPATNLYPRPFFDASETVFWQLDEDFWANLVSPRPLSNLWPQPWAFDNGDGIAFQPGEDYWLTWPVFQANVSVQPFLGTEESTFGVKVYYLADWNPYATGIIRTVIHFEGRAPVEFLNGRFETADPSLQALLDEKPGLASESEWQANYRYAKLLLYKTSQAFPKA